MADLLQQVSDKHARLSESLVTALEKGVEEMNSKLRFIVFIYLLCSVGGLFNSWHILVANFYAHVPPHWCRVPELEAAGWSPQQIRDVSAINNTEQSSCFVLGWNYTLFVKLGYEQSLSFISNSTTELDKTPCKKFYYDEKIPHSTVVSEWDLVCDNKVGKSNVQGSIATGKFVGGLFLGFIADKFGRKSTFLVCCAIYLVSGLGSALAQHFWLFMLTRFGAGIAGAGVYEVGFTLLAELITERHRAFLGCSFNMGYPLGFITLPGLALLFKQWRHLQLALSIPLVIFVMHIWLLPESPRWLLVHGNLEKAWKIVKKYNKKKGDNDFPDNIQEAARRLTEQFQPVSNSLEAVVADIDQFIPGFRKATEEAVDTAVQQVQQRAAASLPFLDLSVKDKIKQHLKNAVLLFSNCELCKRIIISMYNFLVAALVYYVLALNNANFDLSPEVYLFISGWVGAPGYVFPLLVMYCTGRKGATSLLFIIGGVSLVTIASIPREHSYLIMFLAMVGRFTNTAVFGLITVYCAELFPTIVRNSAVGVSLATSQLGSIYAPYIVDLLGPYGWYLPTTICGIFTLVAALLNLLLPETKGKPLLNTIQDVKEQPGKVGLGNCCKCS